MNFVCSTCKDAGTIPGTAHDAPSRAAAATLRRQLHAECRGGTWCDCQHKEGKS